MVGLILACGDGSRLAPFTNNNSKALIPYMNRTALYFQCKKFKEWGIHKIYLFYCKGKYTDFLNAVKELNIELECIHLEKGWKNTWLKATEVITEEVVIINCDLLLDQEFEYVIEEHVNKNADISIACTSKAEVYNGQEGQLAFIDGKPFLKVHTNEYSVNFDVVREVGMSVVNPRIWDLLRKIDFAGVDPWRDKLLPLAIDQGMRVQCIKVCAGFQDIGTWDAIESSYIHPLREFQ